MPDPRSQSDQTSADKQEHSHRVLIGVIVAAAVLVIAVWGVLIILLRGEDLSTLIARSPADSPVATFAAPVETSSVSTIVQTVTVAPSVESDASAPASTSSPLVTATRSPSHTPAPTHTHVPTYTREPTDTPVPTTTPSHTPEPTTTPSPTPLAPAFTVETEVLNVRGGPGVAYPILGQIHAGDSFPISGRSETPAWWEFDFPGADGESVKGWVSGDLTVANVPAEQIALVEAIPTPPAPTATPVPTATSASAAMYNQPGCYPFTDYCYWAPLPSGSHVEFCVESVEVREDGKMQFNVAWTTHSASGGRVTKGADAGNRNMYVTDDLGGHYDHIETSGAAADQVSIGHEETVRGWFLFLPAQAGATTFAFHDDDQGFAIGDIVLAK